MYIYLVEDVCSAGTEIIMVTTSLESAIREYLNNKDANAITVWKDERWNCDYGYTSYECKTNYVDIRGKIAIKLK